MDAFTVYCGAWIGYWVFKGIKSWLEESEHSVCEPPTPDLHRMKPVVESPGVSATEDQPTKRYPSVSDLIHDTYVSYSKLRRYQECPHKFRLLYLDGVPEDRGQFTGDGKDFHERAETALKSLVGCSVAEAQRRTDAHDRRLQRVFRQLPSDSTIKAVEHHLGFTLRDIRYFGIVDLITADPDGVTRLIDYKTGQNPKTHLEQLEIHSMPILLRSLEPRVRCSFILVDTDCHVNWEIGAGNRNSVIGNLIRRVNAMMADTQLKPFVSSRCKDCPVAYACDPKKRRRSVKRAVPTLTSGIRGAAARMRDLRRAENATDTRRIRGHANARSFHAVVGKVEYHCSETGRIIRVGEKHFTTHKGERLSVVGFEKRFPGLPLPAERPRASRSREHATGKSFHPVVGKAEYICTETGYVIPIGEKHFATHKGKRLSAAGFRKRFPGVPLPTE